MARDENCLSEDSASAILRARQGESSAWRALTALYGPVIYNWGRQKGLGSHDASDLSQTVLLKVHRSFSEFRGPSFRAWLRSICKNEIALIYRHSAEELVTVGGTSNMIALANLPEARGRLNSAPDLGADSDPAAKFESVLVTRAMKIVEREYSPKCVQAFLSSVTQARDAADIGRELEMSPAAVRQAKYRILRRIRELLADS